MKGWTYIFKHIRWWIIHQTSNRIIYLKDDNQIIGARLARTELSQAGHLVYNIVDDIHSGVRANNTISEKRMTMSSECLSGVKKEIVCRKHQTQILYSRFISVCLTLSTGFVIVGA